jgi:pyruvate formate lyase activating enzyme
MTGLSINDDETEEVVEAAASFGRETPLHVTAYYPAHRLTNPPTPPELLEDIWLRAKKELDYVYVGNIPGPPANTPTVPVAATQSSRGWAIEP